MSVTQTDAVNWLNYQVGQHLDYDHLYGQQCVDFFNFYYQYVTGDSPYNDGYSVPSAADIWNIANSRFTKIPDSNSLVPQPGDIAVYGTAWGAGNGHVEVVLSTDGNGCTFVGENEHNNTTEGVVKVSRTWAQMRGLLGVLRFSWSVPVATPPPPVYTVIETYNPVIQVKTNKQPTTMWGMNYGTFNAMEANPIKTVSEGTILTIVEKLQHVTGGQYYREPNNVDAWNVLDCDPYTPPPTPYVPPAAPVPIKKAEQYEVFTTLPYYASADDTAQSKNQVGTIAPGTYYVWNKQGTNNNYWDLSISNTTDQGMWINTTLNKKPLNVPVPTPTVPEEQAEATPPAETAADVRASFRPFFPDGSPISCQVVQTFLLTDRLGPGDNITVNKVRKTGKPNVIHIYGTFMQGGKPWALVRVADDPQPAPGLPYYFYGIPITHAMPDASLGPFLIEVDPLKDRLRYYGEYLYDKAVQTIDGIFKKKTKK